MEGMRSSHRATDVPRFTKILSPAEVGGRPLAPAVIERVEYDWEAHVVNLFLEGETEPFPVPSDLRLTVETTARRLDRLAWARAIVAHADALAVQAPTVEELDADDAPPGPCKVCGAEDNVRCCEFGRES